jgi:tetratricopeptide (TPR) repeat protein
MWLVKSGGVVLGPFDRDTLIQMIQTKEVVLHDEVMAPAQRWHYVREEPAFAAAVEKVRTNAMGDREDTVTSTNTQDITVLNAEFSEIATSRHVAAASSGVKKFGTLADENIQNEVRRSSVRAWVLAGIASAIVLFYFWNEHQTTQKKAPPPLTSEELLSVAQNAYSIGDYSRAYEHLTQVHLQMPSNVEINLLLANLMITVENQIVEARRLLQKTKNQTLSAAELSRWHTIMSLADIAEGNFESASENAQAALKLDSQFSPAVINLGTALFLRGEFEKARASFQRATHAPELETLAQILSHRANLERAITSDGAKINIRDTAKYLSQLANDLTDNKQEAFLLSAYAYALADDDDQAMVAAERVLDIDPRMTDEHWHDPLVSRRLLQWSEFQGLCKKIHQINEKSARLNALLAYCQFKGNQLVEAKKTFEASIGLQRADPLVGANIAAFLLGMEQEQEARAPLVMSENQALELPLIMAARVCNREDRPDCAVTHWRKLITINSKNLQALAGLALEFKYSNVGESKELVRKGLSVSPKYIPLLLLQRDLQGLQP